MPEHEMIRLGDVCEFIVGEKIDRSLISDTPEGIPLVFMDDSEDTELDSYYTGKYDEAHLVDEGDYLVNLFEGLSIEAWNGPQALLCDDMCRLIPNVSKLDPRYMYYTLRYIFSKLVDDENEDVYAEKVSVDELKDTVIPLPDIEEQALIADVLDNAYDLMHLQVHQINRSHSLQLARFIEMFGDVEENSKGWTVRPLGALSERLKSRSILAKDREPGDVPYYDSTGVVDHVSDCMFNEDLLLVAKVGNVLTSEEKTIAHAVKGKVWASDLVHVLRLNEEIIPEFAEMVVNNLDIASRLRGGVMPKLPSAALNELPIICPPIQLQVEYVAFSKNMNEQVEMMLKRLGEFMQICNSLNQRYFESSMSYE